MKLSKSLKIIVTITILLFICLILAKKYKKRIDKLKYYIEQQESKINSLSELVYELKLLKKYNAKTHFINEIIPFYEAQLAKENVLFYDKAKNLPNKDEKIKFCIVIPSYNNFKYATQNINSVFFQDYHNWRMIYLDDGSDDGMSQIVTKMKEASGLLDDKFLYIKYEERKRQATYSIYFALHNFCKDDEVMVALDGDDMLSTPKVLDKLAKIYEDKNIWITYGHHMHLNSGELCQATRRATDDEFNNMRTSKWWGYSHLRTGYTWLFKKIKEEDLKFKGEFLKSSWDMALMFPVLEMAGKDRVRYVSDITYLYRSHNNNDAKIYSQEQSDMNKYIRDLSKYQKLENSGQ